jgi:hypothetical protein
MSDFIMEPQRVTPVRCSCDVLVAGGGVGGIAAAIAAARAGADVLLLEREYALGGLATLGLITIYLPLCDGAGTQMAYGLGEELLRLSIKHGAERNYPTAWLDGNDPGERRQARFLTQYNPHIFAIEAEKLLVELGVRILYGSLAVGVAMEGDHIAAVIVENKSGRSAIAVKSVVDCTGDADICALSGAQTALYSAKNGLASWYYYHTQGKVNLKMFGLADVLPDEEGQDGTGNKTVNIISDTRYTGIDGEELSHMVIDARRLMFEDIMKGREEDPELIPVAISLLPLIRMSRRIMGEYALDDSESHKRFDDSIGMTGDWRKRGPAYEIPFRCLYGKEIKNLITAGRDISVTDSMWDITRVIPACAVTGEAAGTAAAMCSDFTALDVGALQKRLLSQGVKLHFGQEMSR